MSYLSGSHVELTSFLIARCWWFNVCHQMPVHFQSCSPSPSTEMWRCKHKHVQIKSPCPRTLSFVPSAHLKQKTHTAQLFTSTTNMPRRTQQKEVKALYTQDMQVFPSDTASGKNANLIMDNTTVCTFIPLCMC